MPAATPETLKAKADAIKKQIADKGDSLEGPELRALKKRLRRAQRKRRIMMQTLEAAAKAAAKTAEKAGESKPEAAAEEKKET